MIATIIDNAGRYRFWDGACWTRLLALVARLDDCQWSAVESQYPAAVRQAWGWHLGSCRPSLSSDELGLQAGKYLYYLPDQEPQEVTIEVPADNPTKPVIRFGENQYPTRLKDIPANATFKRI